MWVDYEINGIKFLTDIQVLKNSGFKFSKNYSLQISNLKNPLEIVMEISSSSMNMKHRRKYIYRNNCKISFRTP